MVEVCGGGSPTDDDHHVLMCSGHYDDKKAVKAFLVDKTKRQDDEASGTKKSSLSIHVIIHSVSLPILSDDVMVVVYRVPCGGVYRQRA